MPYILETTLPDDADHDGVLRDLNELAEGHATVEMRGSARSGQSGKLGQVDPNIVQIVIQMLDTRAAAALVQSVTSGVVGYLLAKSGSKPRVVERPDRDGDG